MKEKEKFYITTAILYASRKPHVGNDYELVFTDSVARYNRMLGKDVYFLTGLDEHGQKIEDLAKEAGVESQKYVDGIYEIVKNNYKLLNISNDGFIRTTDKHHVEVVQKIFKKLYEQGDIYKSQYEGMYCKPCESFWTESQLIDGCCPDCGRPVYRASEEAYFFKLSKYTDRLLEYIENNSGFMMPEMRKKEMINNFIKPGLSDLCVSRTSVKWGIPVDFDDRHTVYVWLDALTNYITAIGYHPSGSDKKFEKLWPADVHMVGKDIFRFHTIYWPIILMALGLPLPKTVLGHPWLLFANDKMSKSKGNILYADELSGYFGVDGVRYYLLSQMPYDKDGNVTMEMIVGVYNSELANTLGNLINRTVAMCNKYHFDRVEKPENHGEVDKKFTAEIDGLAGKVSSLMREYRAADSLHEILSLARSSNKYIDDTAPWILAKNEADRARLQTVMYNLLAAIKTIGVHLAPFMPDTSTAILRQIGIDNARLSDVLSYSEECSYKVAETATPLFCRIDEPKFMAEYRDKTQRAKQEKKENAVEEENKNQITIDDFDKVQLKVAEVMTAEKVEKSDKLLKMTVKLGEETHTVVSGIAKFYTPEEMVGKKVVFVANLKPAKLRGITSEGMILCASTPDDSKVILLQPEKDIESGCPIF